MASQVEHIKWVAGQFMVDGFAFSNSRCKHYFLTHFHSDHTVGLRRGFCDGTIYCTAVTRNLLRHDFRLTPACRIQVLEYGQPIFVEEVRVTAIPANHCPGACMFLFEVPRGAHDRVSTAAGSRNTPCGKAGMEGSEDTEVILHTGDFRWQNWMLECDTLRDKHVHTLYLDTTYANPRYKLPSQDQALERMVVAMRQAMQQEPATLWVVAAYHIGKEKVFLGAARAMGFKVWVNASKRRVLQLLDLPAEDMELLAERPEEAQIHVVHWGLKPQSLLRYFEGTGDPGGVQAAAGQGVAEVVAEEEGGNRTANGGVAEGGDVGTAGAGWEVDAEGVSAVTEWGLTGPDSVHDEATFLRDWDEGATAKAPWDGQGVEPTGLGSEAGLDAPGPDHDGLASAHLPEGAAAQAGDAADAAFEREHIVAQGVRGSQGPQLGMRCWWKRVLGIRATGWTFSRGGRVRVWSQGPVGLMTVPYSEHSSWTDLCDCVKSLKPKRLVPTVNVETPDKFKAMIEKFAPMMDLTNDRSHIHFYLRKQPKLLLPQEESGAGGTRAPLDPTHKASLPGRGSGQPSAIAGLPGCTTVPCETYTATAVEVVVVCSDGSGDEGEQSVLASRATIHSARHARLTGGAFGSAAGMQPGTGGGGSRGISGSRQACMAGARQPGVGSHGTPQPEQERGATLQCSPAIISPSPAAIREVVDLTLVDVGEQERIYQGIVAQNRRSQQQQRRQQEGATPGQLGSGTTAPTRKKQKRAPPTTTTQQQQQEVVGGVASAGPTEAVQPPKRHGIMAFFAPCPQKR